MSLLNKIEISGNLTKDPEMDETKGGTKTAKFDVAHNYKVKDETRVDYFQVQAYGAVAEFIGKNLKKGDPVAVFGEMHINRSDKKQYPQITANTVLKLHRNETADSEE